MTEKKLYYFIVTAECENISQAASKLYIAQPALSRIISKMEEEIGYCLFDRMGKRILLNGNGKIFYQYAKKMCCEYESMQAALAEQNQMQVNHLCVGVCASSQMLPALLHQFRRANGNGQEKIQIKASYPLDFVKDNIDLMIASDTMKTKESGKEYLLSEKILLAVPRGHLLENKEKICLEDTLKYPYVLPAENTCMGKILSGLLEERKIHFPDTSTVTNNSYVQCELVAQGLGVSFIPEKSWVYAHELENITLRPLKDVTLMRNIYVQYHPNKYRSEIMIKFKKYLQQYYHRMDQVDKISNEPDQ